MNSLKKCNEYNNYKKLKRKKDFFNKYNSVIGQCCINKNDCYDYAVDLQELKYECEKIHPLLDKESTDTIYYIINEKLMEIKDKLTELKINGIPIINELIPDVTIPDVMSPINKSPTIKQTSNIKKINTVPFINPNPFKGGKIILKKITKSRKNVKKYFVKSGTKSTVKRINSRKKTRKSYF
jgi:hypothetical protein